MLRPSARLLLGDCRTTIQDLDENSVDAVITDPPYGLSEDPDIREVLEHWLAGDAYEHGSAGFMGKTWDSFVPGPEYWRECYRVLKPGGHLVAFSSNRTEDLLGIAIRLAGFRRRDLIAWLYYNGFPKSLDISKEFDRMRDDRADVLKVTAAIAWARDDAELTNADIDAALGTAGMAGHWTTQKSQPAVPKPDQWELIKGILDWHPSAEIEELVARLNARKGTWGNDRPDRATAIAEDSFVLGVSHHVKDAGTPQTEEARRWQGWGTAIKPALEPALVFQKPISEGSVARNVRKWGTGAINLAAASYPVGDPCWPGWGEKLDPSEDPRFPANIYHCKKPSTAEREAGCDHLPKKNSSEMVDREEGSDGTKSPRAGAGRASSGRSNFHPTVKPVALMRWLVRLLTPPGGTVLDPFMGSGTTGVACMAERFNFIGCELSAEYMPIPVARIDYAAQGADVDAPDGTRSKRVQPMLFGGS